MTNNDLLTLIVILATICLVTSYYLLKTRRQIYMLAKVLEKHSKSLDYLYCMSENNCESIKLLCKSEN